MTKRKKAKEHDYLRGVMLIIWVFLQFWNVMISLAVFDAFGNIYYAKNSMALPMFTSLILYLLLRNFNYGICRIFGYHAASELNEIQPFIGLDYHLHSGFIFPTFVKTTKEYRELYKSRSKFLQVLFYLVFVVIVAGTAGLFMYVEFLLFNKNIPNSAVIAVGTAVVLGLLLYFVTQNYYAIFPKIFNLQVILKEHNQPIYIRNQSKVIK